MACHGWRNAFHYGDWLALDHPGAVVKEEYFTVTGRCAVKTQTGLILALKYHLSEDEDMIKYMLKKLFRENKYKLNTGFVGTSLLCNVLTENEMTDIAYQLLLNENGHISLPYASDAVYADRTNPMFENVKERICYVKTGKYEVVYEVSETIKKRYSIDSTLDELLRNPYVRKFLATIIEVDMVYDLSLRDVAKIFSGEIEAEQEQTLNAALEKF